MKQPRWQAALALLVGMGLVVAAWGVLELAPSTETAQSSIPVAVAVGVRVTVGLGVVRMHSSERDDSATA